jgi:membrane protein DedA with SNARE-associated domain
MLTLALFNLTTVEGWIASGGLIVLFLLLFACGLGLPLPEDVPLTVAGYLIANGEMNLVLACIFAWCGIIAGDLVLYHLGKHFGLEITRVPFVGKHVTRERIKWVEAKFQKYGIWVVAIGRMVAGVRGAMVVAAGATRFNLIKFIIADGLAAVVSGVLFLFIGHWLGKKFSIDEIGPRIEHAKHYFTLGIILVALAVIVWAFLRRNKGVAAVPPAGDGVDASPKEKPFSSATTPVSTPRDVDPPGR